MAAGAAANTPGTASSSIVMVVDDTEEALLLAERHLTGAGYRVLTAENGRTALRRVKLVRPDLILLDVNMPEMDGYEVCALLQRDPQTAFIPVIFCTALSDEQNKSRALAVGAADYLVKPVRRETLLAIVRTHLETRVRWSLVLDASGLSGEERFRAFCAELIDSLHLLPDRAEALRQLRTEQLAAVPGIAGIDETELAQRVARFVGLTPLEEIDPDAIHLSMLPPAFCRARGVVPLTDASLGEVFAIANPFVWDPPDIELLTRAAGGRPCRLVVVPPQVLVNLFGEPPGPTSAAGAGEAPRRLAPIASETLPHELLGVLQGRARELGAPEALLQPCADTVRVRYRVGGRLVSFGTLTPDQLAGVATWLDENPAAGTGVERLGTAHGEQLLLRFEEPASSELALESLGMEPETLAAFQAMLARGEGLVLLAGPARSGRTTALRAALRSFDPDSRSLLLIEDRPSRDLPGVARLLTAPEACAGALERVREQRLDVVAVDGLRSAESATAACRAALSGSLVLAVATAGPAERTRLDGAPADLARIAVAGVLSHLLVPRVCESCSAPHTPGRVVGRRRGRQPGGLPERRRMCRLWGHRASGGGAALLDPRRRCRGRAPPPPGPPRRGRGGGPA
jgi:general secretion pathway protein E